MGCRHNRIELTVCARFACCTPPRLALFSGFLRFGSRIFGEGGGGGSGHFGVFPIKRTLTSRFEGRRHHCLFLICLGFSDLYELSLEFREVVGLVSEKGIKHITPTPLDLASYLLNQLVEKLASVQWKQVVAIVLVQVVLRDTEGVRVHPINLDSGVAELL